MRRSGRVFGSGTSTVNVMGRPLVIIGSRPESGHLQCDFGKVVESFEVLALLSVK